MVARNARSRPRRRRARSRWWAAVPAVLVAWLLLAWLATAEVPPAGPETGVPPEAGSLPAAQPPPAEPDSRQPTLDVALSVRLDPPVLQPGDLLVIKVGLPGPGGPFESLRAGLLGRSLELSPHRGGWVGLAGVDYRTPPGRYPVTVTAAGPAGLAGATEVLVVEPKAFAESRLTVTAEQTALLAEDLVLRDRDRVARARARSHAAPLWKGSFLLPVEGRLTTDFGHIRFVNGRERGRHSGVDLAAPTGTPVRATNHGEVVLAEALHVTGLTVIIDHGLGLYSSYGHLSAIDVAPGQRVSAGDRIGAVGSTGFSMGPHLHWSMIAGGVFVNPWRFAGASLELD